MKSVALIYASLHGQTKKIAKHMKGHLESMGIKAPLLCAEDSLSEEIPPDIDGAVIGGPVYAKRYPSSLIEWIPRHKALLDSKPLAFFSVSLNAADQHPEARQADDEMIQKFLKKSQLSPHFVASFGGSLNFSDYNWFIKFLMRRLSAKAGGGTDTSKDYEYTDWRMVDSFIEDFVQGNADSPYVIDHRLRFATVPPRAGIPNEISTHFDLRK
jgi:menaquinone-dependent protoporphyrinogen oxidase